MRFEMRIAISTGTRAHCELLSSSRFFFASKGRFLYFKSYHMPKRSQTALSLPIKVLKNVSHYQLVRFLGIKLSCYALFLVVPGLFLMRTGIKFQTGRGRCALNKIGERLVPAGRRASTGNTPTVHGGKKFCCLFSHKFSFFCFLVVIFFFVVL